MKFNGRNVFVSPNAKLGRNVKIGDNCTIYDGVEIGDDTIVCNDSVLGEPLNAYYSDPNYKNPPTIIGANSIIRSHTIIYAACTMGAGFSTGHRVTIRENTTIGESCSVGTLSDLQGQVKIGKYCRLHSNVHLAQGSTIGDFVFLYPYVVMTNDPYPPSTDIRGGFIGSYTQVGVHAIILPGIKVGENCLVGANTVINKRLPDFSLAMGDPMKVVMDVRQYVAMGKGNPYPWMKRFDRGMPWQGIGYDVWMQQNAAKQTT
jgi:acetyltransferase-like isoleucine patch superfamily enzyme